MTKRLFSKEAKAKREKDGSLPALIRALMADYERRKVCIMEKSTSRRVRMEYEYINSRIFEGAGEIVGGAIAEKFIKEIGMGIGYAHSDIGCYSESAYKRNKAEIIVSVARKLHLSD